MKCLNFFLCTAFLVVALYFVHAEFKGSDCKIHAEFLKFHSNLDTLESEPWALADNLQCETLKKVCDEVLLDNPTPFMPFGRFEYHAPLGEIPLQLERVLRSAPVVCVEGLKCMTLIHCSYNETNFYLARGDDTHVFRLSRDRLDKIFYFQSGPHLIHTKGP